MLGLFFRSSKPDLAPYPPDLAPYPEVPEDRRVEARAIRDIMSVDPVTVGPKTPLREVHRLFRRYGFNAFPVVDENRTLLGIVAKLDLFRLFRHDRARLRPRLSELFAETAEDIMRPRVSTVRPGDSVNKVMDLMLGSKLRSVPVVEREGRAEIVVGIVTNDDVVRSMELAAA